MGQLKKYFLTINRSEAKIPTEALGVHEEITKYTKLKT